MQSEGLDGAKPPRKAITVNVFLSDGIDLSSLAKETYRQVKASTLPACEAPVRRGSVRGWLLRSPPEKKHEDEKNYGKLMENLPSSKGNVLKLTEHLGNTSKT